VLISVDSGKETQTAELIQAEQIGGGVSCPNLGKLADDRL